jgi:GR25 family glycosyltransferase involved in LPS biosynthesis
MIAEGDEDAALILEDDVVFSRNAGALLRNPDLIKSGADVIRLESVPMNIWLSTKAIPLGDGYHVCASPYGAFGAAAYIVTKKGARELVAQSRHYVWPVDLWLFLNEAGKPRARIVVHAINPAPCTQFLFAFPERVDAAGITSTLDHPVITAPLPGVLSRLQTRIVSRVSKTWRRLRSLRKVVVNLHPAGPLPEFD